MRAASEKQEAIFEAATREFAKHGYDDASVNRILLAAGFSKGLFYYYFDDKADLALAVIERLAKDYLPSLALVKDPETPEEFWREQVRLAERHMGALKEMPTTTDALLRLASALARHPELVARLSGTVMAEATEKMTRLWKRGQEIGAVRQDLSLEALFALLQETKLTLIRVLLPHDRAPTAEEATVFARTHLDLVRRVAERRA